jgi:hypothetical protein
MPIIMNDDGNYINFDFRLVEQLLRKQWLEDPLEFFNFLIRFKTNDDLLVLCDGVINNKPGVKCSQVSDAVAFRTMICELFYRAINYFDIVETYTIHCKNNVCETNIVIGHQPGKLDDQNMPAMASLRTQWGEYILNYEQIYLLYIANRIKDPDFETINSFMILLFMTGNEPRVRTSYTIRKDIIATTTKF